MYVFVGQSFGDGCTFQDVCAYFRTKTFRVICRTIFQDVHVVFQVAQIMVPHLRFYFHELVRAAAAEILPHLLECVQVKGQCQAPPTLRTFRACIQGLLMVLT